MPIIRVVAVSPTLLFNQAQDELHPGEHLLPPGTLVGDDSRYRITRIVAIGGMATVYQAMDTRLEMQCAIKALYLPGVTDPTEAAAFRRESELLASLHFPGIVAVRDYFVEIDFAFLVMDYVEGQNLYDRHHRTGRLGEDVDDLDIAPVPEDQVVLYGLGLAQALHYMHTRAAPIVYRDMKPHNVMRSASDGRIVLLDFGIARRMRAHAKSCRSDDLGTPGYAAPEQYERSGTIDARTDIYSLGVVLVELATGYNPRAEGAARHVPPVHELPATTSPMLASILQRCLEIQPKERYQSAKALVEALERWQQTPRLVRRRSLPKRSWKFHANARARGAMLAAGTAIYAADSAGTLYVLDASVGHLNGEQELPVSKRDPSARYALTASHAEGDAPKKLALTINTADRASLMLFDDNLLPLQRVASKGRLLSTWTSSDTIALVSSEPGEIAMLACASKREWHYTWRSKLNFAASAIGVHNGSPILLDSSGTVRAYDAATGETRWERWLSARAGTRMMAPIGEILLIGGCRGDTSMTAFDAESGQICWQAPGVGVPLSAPLLSADGKILIVSTVDAGLVLVDLKRGDVLARIGEFKLPLVGASHFNPATDIIALTEYGEGGRLVLYDVARQRTIWSETLGDKGAVAPPIVCEEMIIAQEAHGCITSWTWGNAR